MSSPRNDKLPTNETSEVKIHIAEGPAVTFSAPSDRATIGIRCSNLEIGAAFYRKVQNLMAQLYPDEYNRPKIFVDLGGDDENASTLLGVHRKGFDLILVPHKKTQDLTQENKSSTSSEFNREFLPSKLFTLAYPNQSLTPEERDILNNKVDKQLFKDFEVKVVDQSKFKHHAGLKCPVIGLIGGMGPEADGYTLEKMAKNSRTSDTPVRIYLMSDPRVPRTMGQKVNINKLSTYKKRLKTFLQIPEVSTYIASSNTFHIGNKSAVFTYAQIKSKNKLLSILDAVQTKAKQYTGEKIGILATHITAESGIYKDLLEQEGATPIVPDVQLQERINEGITAMKMGNNALAGEIFVKVIEKLKTPEGGGAKIILLGCTEIPLALENVKLPDELIYMDSAEILGSTLLETIHFTPDKNKYFNAVRTSLLEYKTINREKKKQLSPCYTSVFLALIAAQNGSQSTFDTLIREVDNTISGKSYSILHKKRDDGLDAILEKNIGEKKALSPVSVSTTPTSFFSATSSTPSLSPPSSPNSPPSLSPRKKSE